MPSMLLMVHNVVLQFAWLASCIILCCRPAVCSVVMWTGHSW